MKNLPEFKQRTAVLGINDLDTKKKTRTVPYKLVIIQFSITIKIASL